MNNAKRMAKLLNELLDLGPKDIVSLLNHRQVVGKEILDHPTVQVLVQDGFPLLGFLGIINGFLLQTNDEIVVLKKPNKKLFRYADDFYSRDLIFEAVKTKLPRK